MFPASGSTIQGLTGYNITPRADALQNKAPWINNSTQKNVILGISIFPNSPVAWVCAFSDIILQNVSRTVRIIQPVPLKKNKHTHYP